MAVIAASYSDELGWDCIIGVVIAVIALLARNAFIFVFIHIHIRKK
jgi:hypothetical protein